MSSLFSLRSGARCCVEVLRQKVVLAHEGQCEGNGLCDVKAMVQRRVPLHPPP